VPTATGTFSVLLGAPTAGEIVPTNVVIKTPLPITATRRAETLRMATSSTTRMSSYPIGTTGNRCRVGESSWLLHCRLFASDEVQRYAA
jgi:hypothetical protein